MQESRTIGETSILCPLCRVILRYCVPSSPCCSLLLKPGEGEFAPGAETVRKVATMHSAAGRQTVTGRLRSVHLLLVSQSAPRTSVSGEWMNKTPLEPFQAAQLPRGRSQGMPTCPRVPSRCRTFLHSVRIIAREDERGCDRPAEWSMPGLPCGLLTCCAPKRRFAAETARRAKNRNLTGQWKV